MEIVKNLTNWRNSNKDNRIMPLLRIVLGVMILFKGFSFILQGGAEMEGIDMSSNDYMPMLFGQWIPVLEIAAGILIGIGLITRICSVFQMLLSIAVLLFSKDSAVLSSFQQSQYVLSIVIILLSAFFAFWGSGMFSAENALKKENKREEDHFWHRETK